MNQNAEQYLVWSEPPPGSSWPESPRRQPKKSLDIIPAFLDLPCPRIAPLALERRLKILALFYEHLVVPDGWLHCSGPVSEYLRGKVERQANKSPFVGTNTVLELLETQILVPGLRGYRAKSASDRPRGFDLKAVHNGDEIDPAGGGFGVYRPNDEERATVLDPTEVNLCIVDAMSSHVRLYLDWGAPTVPIDLIGYDDVAVKQEWDADYAKRAFDFLLRSESAFTGQEDFERLLGLGFIKGRQTELGRTRWEVVFEGLKTLSASSAIRRGDFEKIVGKAFELRRLKSYEELRRIRQHADDVTILDRDGCEPRPMSPSHVLTSALLDRVTSIQEEMFRDKFRASLSFQFEYSYDWLVSSLESNIPTTRPTKFHPERHVIWNSPINFGDLPVPTIVNLRERARKRGYFDAMRDVKYEEHFWEANPVLKEQLTAYVADIASVAPLSRGTDEAVGIAASSGVGAAWAGITGIAAFAGSHMVGLDIGAQGVSSFTVLGFVSATVGGAVFDRLTGGRVRKPIIDLVKQYSYPRNRDVTLRAFGIHDDSPPAVNANPDATNN